MTPEEAREYPLSRNPFKRTRQVYGLMSEEFHLREVGWGAGGFRGRGTLVGLAEAAERAHEIMDKMSAIEERDAAANAGHLSLHKAGIELEDNIEGIELYGEDF